MDDHQDIAKFIDSIRDDLPEFAAVLDALQRRITVLEQPPKQIDGMVRVNAAGDGWADQPMHVGVDFGFSESSVVVQHSGVDKPVLIYSVDAQFSAVENAFFGVMAELEATAEREAGLPARTGATRLPHNYTAGAEVLATHCMPSEQPGVFAAAMRQENDAPPAAPLKPSRVKPAISGLTTEASGDHRLGGWGATG